MGRMDITTCLEALSTRLTDAAAVAKAAVTCARSGSEGEAVRITLRRGGYDDGTWRTPRECAHSSDAVGSRSVGSVLPTPDEGSAISGVVLLLDRVEQDATTALWREGRGNKKGLEKQKQMGKRVQSLQTM